MIAGIFHQGSGIGNQLHRYVMTRVLALDKKLDFGMINPELCKVNSFMNLDMGVVVKNLQLEYFEKKELNDAGVDVRDYDWQGISYVHDNTLIDGEFQGEKYYEHHRDKIDHWLSVKPLLKEDDVCVIGFRGGEYVGVPELFLPRGYWSKAIQMMKDINPKMRFEVHTDDPKIAEHFFPDYPILQDPEMNWRSVRYAKYLIIANSSFYIFPAWLNKDAFVIAPQYWARPYSGYWALQQNQYKDWNYI